MARAQTAVKKGRASSSAKKRNSAKSRREGANRRPEAKATRQRKSNPAMAGSKAKGSNRQARGNASKTSEGRQGADRGDDDRQQRSGEWTGGEADTGRGRMEVDDTGYAPETVPQPVRSPDARMGDQSRAASGQDDEARTNRPPNPTQGKPGSRGGAPVERQAGDREAAKGERLEAPERPAAHGDSREQGREEPTPAHESARGSDSKGGREGRDARARRAGLGFRED